MEGVSGFGESVKGFEEWDGRRGIEWPIRGFDCVRVGTRSRIARWLCVSEGLVKSWGGGMRMK